MQQIFPILSMYTVLFDRLGEFLLYLAEWQLPHFLQLLHCLLFQQQSAQLMHGRERQEFHMCWTFSTVDACVPYWASHTEITLLMTS